MVKKTPAQRERERETIFGIISLQMKLLAVFFLLVLATPALVHCNLERDILYKLRASWEDPNNVLQSWDPTLVNPCSWFHVTCNNNNSVIRVDLGVAGLSGPLLPQLAKLENLQYLELFGNNITGSIPRAFGNLKRLVSMDLHHNRLSGSIPPTLGKIKTMKYLRLNSNYLTGHVPLEILHLVLTGNLIELNVSSNQLSGRVRTSKLRVVTITLDAKKSSG